VLPNNHRACRMRQVNGHKITLLKIQEQMWRALAYLRSMTLNRVVQLMAIKKFHLKAHINNSIHQIQSHLRLGRQESWSYLKTKSLEFKKMDKTLSATLIVYKTKVFHRFDLNKFFLNIQAQLGPFWESLLDRAGVNNQTVSHLCGIKN